MFFDKKASIFFLRRGSLALIVTVVAIIAAKTSTTMKTTFTSTKCGTNKCGQ